MNRTDIVEALKKERIVVNEHTVALAANALNCGRAVKLDPLIAEALKENAYRSAKDVGNVLGKSKFMMEGHMTKMKRSDGFADVTFLSRGEKSGAKSAKRGSKRLEKDTGRVLSFCRRHPNTSMRKIERKLHIAKSRVSSIVGQLKTKQAGGRVYQGVNFPLSREEKRTEQKKQMDYIAETYRENKDALVKDIAVALGITERDVQRFIRKMRELQRIEEYKDVPLPWTQKELDDNIISKLVDDPNKSNKQIADELKIHRETVANCITRQGGIQKILKTYKILPWEVDRIFKFYWDVPKNREYYFIWMTAIEGIKPIPGSDEYIIYEEKRKRVEKVSLRTVKKKYPRIATLYETYRKRFAEGDSATKMLKADWEQAMDSNLFVLLKFLISRFPNTVFTPKDIRITLAGNIATMKQRGDLLSGKNIIQSDSLEVSAKSRYTGNDSKNLHRDKTDLNWLGLVKTGRVILS